MKIKYSNKILRFSGRDIPKGEIKTPFEINKFLNTKETLYNNKSEFIKNWTFDGENQKHLK